MKKRNTKKLTRAAIAAAVMTSASASAEVVLTENLSLTGFLGISANNLDKDAYGESESSSDSSGDIDEFEVDFLFSKDKINAQVDLNYLGGPGDVELEQAHISYAVSDSFSLKAGKFLSCIGYETFDMNGLYQYSPAASTMYPGHHTGLAGVYSGDAFGVYASAVADTWDPKGTDIDSAGYEVQVFTSPVEGLTVKLGYATGDEGTYDKEMLNLWAGYEVGSLTLAAEYSNLDNFTHIENFDSIKNTDPDGPEFLPLEYMYDGDAYMLMGNYAFTDRFNATLRYAHVDADRANLEIDEFTISPRFVISDSVSVITEYRHRDYDVGADEDLLAARLLYTF